METSAARSSRVQQYYLLNKHWESELEFFEIETAFLHRLLDNYFVRLQNPAYFENLRQTGAKLFKLEKDENDLRKQLSGHLKQLELTAENVIPGGVRNLTDVQIEIESVVERLMSEYRLVKKELFALERGMAKRKAGRWIMI